MGAYQFIDVLAEHQIAHLGASINALVLCSC